MKITFMELTKMPGAVSAVIHSLECSIYQVTISTRDTSRLLVDDNGKPMRWRSLAAARTALKTLPIATLTLQQLSAYDEMIGQPPKLQTNLLEIPLSTTDDSARSNDAASVKRPTSIHPRPPCRGCRSTCSNYSFCDGRPWRTLKPAAPSSDQALC